jgi:hypothetical protein
MHWIKSGMVSWESVLPFGNPSATAAVRDCIRFAAVVGLLALFVYRMRTAWDVLGDLGHVKLMDCRSEMNVVSVRDAVLCVVGYRIGTELLRAVVRARRPE